MRVALAILLTFVATAAPAQSRLDPAAAAILQDGLIVTADQFILPAYEDQALAAGDLRDALEGYCAGAAGIEPVHDAFAETFLAWQRSSLVGIGPIAAAEGPHRVQLWPDSKGFAARAVRTAVGSEDPALTAAGGLEGRSIALTNLTALETLLYADLPPDSFACDLAQAIAAFQRDLADDLVVAWSPGSPFRTAFDTAIAGNALFASVDDLIRRVLAGAVVQVDRLRKFKIERGLGTAPGQARPERTEATAAGLGLDSIEATFRALSDLYAVPGGLFDAAPTIGGSMAYLTLSQTGAALADDLSFRERALSDIATEDGPDAAFLRGLADRALRHETFLKSGFPASIGLTAGFTAADGD